MDFPCGPRLPVPPISDDEIVVQAPPEVPRAIPANPLGRLLPLAMVVAAVGMMVLYFNSGAAVMRNPMFMFFPVMMLVSVVGSLAYGARGGNRTAEINADRRDYLQYIDTLDQAAVKDRERATSGACTGAIPNRERCGHWWVAGACGSGVPVIRISVRCDWDSATQRLSTRLVAPEVGPLDKLDPVTSMALRRFIRSRSMVAEPPDRIGALPATCRSPSAAMRTLSARYCAPSYVSSRCCTGLKTFAWSRWSGPMPKANGSG